MKIGIDGRFWGIEHTGIGRYLMQLVINLQKIDRQNKYVIFLRKKYFNKLKFENPNFSKVLADFPHYSFSEQTYFKKILEKEKLDLVHFPHFNLPLLYRGKFIVTIHDLIKHESRGALTTTRLPVFYWFKFLAYLLTINLAVRRAEKVIVPSLWWKKRLRQKFNLKPKKIKVTYESVSKEFLTLSRAVDKRMIDKVLKKYGVCLPFVVYTGNLYPHKNIIRLAEAMREINKQKSLSLLIVCAKSPFWQRLRKEADRLKAGNFIILAGFVPDDELISLYQAAEAFVFPTLLEGFGLPGLEAMATGLPVVCSRASCLPEIYQKAALYFDPRQSDDIKNKILRLLGSQKLKNRLIKSGYRRIKKFSWQKMARETLEVYKSVSS